MPLVAGGFVRMVRVVAEVIRRPVWTRVRLWLGRTPVETRRRILLELFSVLKPEGVRRFAVMMALSVVIAVMGLATDSTAVVIGAMLVAPLMTPVLAVAAAASMGMLRRLLTAGTLVFVTSVGSVLLAWGLAAAVPGLSLNDEIVARTSPQGADMVVALAAGAAGAYATTRPSISAALPGVAVAVALVPPLATIGVAIELERGDLAEGAFLLYCANLFGIILMSVAVFLLAGFVPFGRLSTVGPRVLMTTLIVAAATAAVGVPLTLRSLDVAHEADVREHVNRDVLDWLGPTSALEASDVRLDGSRVTVDVVGPAQPPATDELASRLVTTVGHDVEVTVRWSQRSTVQPDETDRLAADGPNLTEQITPVVEVWLADGAAGDRVVSTETSERTVELTVIGPDPPPAAEVLATAIEGATGLELEVVVHWTEQRVFNSTEQPPPVDAATLAEDAAQAWASTVDPDLDVVDVEVADDLVTVDLAGESPPSDLTGLLDAVHSVLADDPTITIRVRFQERQLLPIDPGQESGAAAGTEDASYAGRLAVSGTH